MSVLRRIISVRMSSNLQIDSEIRHNQLTVIGANLEA
jgi:hypothetical protein